MKIGIISDTHDRLESIKKAIELFEQNNIELIIHCGDWVSPFTLEFFDATPANKIPIKSVYGDNEGDIKRIIECNLKLSNPIEFCSKQAMELDLDGRKAIIYHGHDKAVLNALIKSQLYDVILTGHSHIVRNETEGKTLILNPGSTCFASGSKMIDKASVAIYDSTNNSAEIVEFSKKDV